MYLKRTLLQQIVPILGTAEAMYVRMCPCLYTYHLVVFVLFLSRVRFVGGDGPDSDASLATMSPLALPLSASETAHLAAN